MWWFLYLKPILYFLKSEQIFFFEKAVYLIKKGAHLTTRGLTDIISIKASMNKGLSDKWMTHFTNIGLGERPVLTNKRAINNNWLAGFTDGEGSFYLRIKEASTAKILTVFLFSFL